MRIVVTSISFCEYVLQQANALAKIGHQVLLVVPQQLVDSTVGAKIADIPADNVRLCLYDVKRRRTLALYKEVLKVISEFQPEVIHIHDNGEIETLAILAKLRRYPIVVTKHDVQLHSGADSLIGLRRRSIMFLLALRAYLFTVHSNHLKTQLIQLYPQSRYRTEVIPHGTLSLFKQWADNTIKKEPYTCLFFGRMEKYRGLDNLVTIGKLLKKELPEIKIIIAGTGTELKKYLPSFRSLGIFEIHDTFIPDCRVAEFFQRSSLLLLPYHEASQSGVLHVAVAFGLPAVANAVGAIPEVIQDNQHGRLIDVGDHHGFAKAVTAILRDRGTLARMEEGCLSLGRKLEYDNLSGYFLNAYSRAISEKRGFRNGR